MLEWSGCPVRSAHPSAQARLGPPTALGLEEEEGCWEAVGHPLNLGPAETSHWGRLSLKRAVL